MNSQFIISKISELTILDIEQFHCGHQLTPMDGWNLLGEISKETTVRIKTNTLDSERTLSATNHHYYCVDLITEQRNHHS